MPVPSPLLLDNFARTIWADPDILGVLYFGLLGRGAAGHFADLGILV
jgi:hypothetical protein